MHHKLLICALPFLALAATELLATDNAPPPTHLQIEADWLRQDVKRLAPTAGTSTVTREADAAGAVDGVKNGQWGFHTALEANPWWQVDLGEAMALERVMLWNRCDGGFAARNGHLRVLLSSDGQSFEQVYAHDGTAFYGYPDQKPLMVKLNGARARFVRLALPGQNYFHLDEVEIYAVGQTANVALHRPATQSSTSQWSVWHAPPLAAHEPDYPIALTVKRGLKLAESLQRLGVDVTTEQANLREIESLRDKNPIILGSEKNSVSVAPNSSADPSNASDSDQRFQQRDTYLRTHWIIRQLALKNPLLNFDSILFVKRAPTMFPHMSDQHYGWWSRGGGGIYVLENFKTGQARVRCLTDRFPEGNFAGPDLSFDGTKVLFAYCKFYPDLQNERNKADKTNVPEDAFYHLFEMNVNGSGLRQITHGKYDDFDPRYLPSSDLLFLSTRKGQALQSTMAFADSTRQANLPDSYVRCGGDNWRPVPVFTLHGINADGTRLRPLSAFENFEWAPSVAGDGRILYTRWDYIDRFNGHFFSLWSANQDGTNPQLVYGNYTTKPQVALEARSIPGSDKLVFTASAHHSITGGSLCLLDRNRGLEGAAPITRLTPEVCFPETEGSPEHYYANPWPLTEDYFLVGWADAKLPPHSLVKDNRNPPNAMGIYLYDAFGNLELLYRDPDISSMNPIPVTPRPRPPVQTIMADWQGTQEGRFLVQNVYEGLDGVARGRIKRLRIVGVPPKVQPQMNSPVLGVSAEDPGKFVLGTVPVEADGSAHFRVPSGVPVFFQALDADGLAVQTMRSLTYTMPGQTLSCVGCHEHRDRAPATGPPALAALREPSKLTPGPSGSWPLRFGELVQPVLDQKCVNCHFPGSEDADAAQLDLTAAKAWQSLMTFANEDLKKQAFERDRSLPGTGTAANSKLWKLLTSVSGHKDVALTADDRERLATWMDTYAQQLGYFSAAQEKELVSFRQRMEGLFRDRVAR